MLRTTRVVSFSPRFLSSGFASGNVNIHEPIEDFRQHLVDNGIRRALIHYDHDKEQVVASHPSLNGIVDWMVDSSNPDFDKHEAVFLQIGQRTQDLMGAFIFKTVRGQGCGGVRYRQYDTLQDYLRDGLRLATGMGLKSALAGLWAGGAKGCIHRRCGVERRADETDLFLDYGDFLTSLRGAYVGAEDAGVTEEDCAIMFRRTRFLTCIPSRLGGSGNPSIPTARGIVCAMEAAIAFLDGGSDDVLAGKSIAIQGCGQVGLPLIQFLLEKNVGKVYAVDPSAARLLECARVLEFNNGGSFPSNVVLEEVDKKDPNAILGAEGYDIVSPNAYGGVLWDETVNRIKARVVCGAANNQLVDPHCDYGMSEKGITYIPDFVANRMGIVNCANEAYGHIRDDPAVLQHLDHGEPAGIFQTVQSVLEVAQNSGTTTLAAANELATTASNIPHPIWGLRTRAIIKDLSQYWTSEL